MAATQVHLITNCFAIMSALLTDNEALQKVYPVDVLERLFLYSICWSLGGLLEGADRVKLSMLLLEMSPTNVPQLEEGDDLFDYYVDEQTMNWRRWQAPDWEYDSVRFNFSASLVPTVDSARAEFVIKLMLSKLSKPVLVVGSSGIASPLYLSLRFTPLLVTNTSGTAKTSLVLQYTSALNPSEVLLKKINFSSATTAGTRIHYSAWGCHHVVRLHRQRSL